MKKSYRLIGLDCANCAAKMERKIQKLAGVKEASVNFMTTKMILEVDDSLEESVFEEVTKIIKSIEPDVLIKKA